MFNILPGQSIGFTANSEIAFGLGSWGAISRIGDFLKITMIRITEYLSQIINTEDSV